jgi:hypothetical protein
MLAGIEYGLHKDPCTCTFLASVQYVEHGAFEQLDASEHALESQPLMAQL